MVPPAILIVDDNPFNIMVNKIMVEEEGYTTLAAYNGQEAILMFEELHSKSNIKLILMDCEMPVMDGLEATRILRRKMNEKVLPDIPIVGISGNSSTEYELSLSQAGMAKSLCKPVLKAQLNEVLRRYCPM